MPLGHICNLNENCLFWTYNPSGSVTKYWCMPYFTTDDTPGSISGWKDCPPESSEIQSNIHYGILKPAPKLDFPCPQNNTGFKADLIHDIASWQDCGKSYENYIYSSNI